MSIIFILASVVLAMNYFSPNFLSHGGSYREFDKSYHEKLDQQKKDREEQDKELRAIEKHQCLAEAAVCFYHRECFDDYFGELWGHDKERSVMKEDWQRESDQGETDVSFFDWQRDKYYRLLAGYTLLEGVGKVKAVSGDIAERFGSVNPVELRGHIEPAREGIEGFVKQWGGVEDVLNDLLKGGGNL